MTKPILQVKQLSVMRQNPRPLLSDISFAIQSNEVVGLMGPNGAGKTTLLRCLYSAETHYQGDIRFKGRALKSLTNRQRARHIAAITQETPADFQLDVEAVLRTGRTPYQTWFNGHDRKAKQTIAYWVERFNLEAYLKRDLGTLSGGERKRVMLCRALIQEPQLLILDEPCNHLDIAHQLEILQLLRDLPVSCVVSLHDFVQAARFCDRLLVLDQGKMVADGDAERILTPALFAKVFAVAVQTYTNPYQQWSFYPSSI